MTSQQLAKAQLYSLDGENYHIEFMFNPTQLEFSRGIKLNQPSGARSQRGQPKVTFAEPDPCVLSLSKILFDTYEEERDVFKEYIEPLIKAVKFLDSSVQGSGQRSAPTTPVTQHSQSTQQRAQNKRPPIYLFTWGEQKYMRCFVESLKYQLTLFMPNGKPVRATVSLTLKEVDDSVGPADPRTPASPNRTGNTRWRK